jgi:hypothetical protein
VVATVDRMARFLLHPATLSRPHSDFKVDEAAVEDVQVWAVSAEPN